MMYNEIQLRPFYPSVLVIVEPTFGTDVAAMAFIVRLETPKAK